MIIKAEKQHVPFIIKRLSSFKKTTYEEIVSFIYSPHEVIYVDTEKEIVCRINTNEKKSRLVWLLPQNENLNNLYLVLGSALIYLYKKYPERRNNIIWGKGSDKRGCLRIMNLIKAHDVVKVWTKFFPSSEIKYRWWDNSWIIWGIHKEVVRDVLKYLKNTNIGVPNRDSSTAVFTN